MLSAATWNLLDACFGSDEQRNQIAARLEREVFEQSDPELLERIRISIIRLILENQDKDYADTVFDLANTDWRDVLMAAGHGDLTAHSTWAAMAIRECPRIVIEEPKPKTLRVDKNGWARCPSCSFRFKLSDPNAWDGKRHRRCLQRLRIEGGK